MSTVASQERLMQVILGPHVSEKSTAAAQGARQVVFRVRRDATKPEIRKAVEFLFEVKVESVAVVRGQGKVKRHGKAVKGTIKTNRIDLKNKVCKVPGQDFKTAK